MRSLNLKARFGARWPRSKLWLLRGVCGMAVTGVLLLGVRYWPHAPLSAMAPSSRVVLAGNGELLRMTLASDGQYRVWLPLEQIAPSMQQALLLKEDRHFYAHVGVSPAALLRAALATYSGGQRQGGSTLSMQLARRLYGLSTRKIPGKIQQIGLALWLEARYSKHDILEAYLNYAPMGGNIEGVEAASWIYFTKSAERLSLSEALALAVLPQQPGRRGAFGPTLQTARQRLMDDWRQTYPQDPRNDSLLDVPLTARTRQQVAFLAPHFSEQVLASAPGTELRTTLDLPLQHLLERLVGRFIDERRSLGVENAVAVLVDSRDQSVKALVGSADYFSASIQGQVNGALAQRSPGSALKPFLYGLGIDQGIIHPMSILKDLPSSFGYFQPENFDRDFSGPVTAQDALIRSRNVPAVWLANQVHAPSLYGLLQRAGVKNLRDESFYGLGLALGAGEVSMEDLARLYLALSGDGRLRPLRYLTEQKSEVGPALLSPQAAFMVRDMLRHHVRPDGLPRAQSWPVAWKTGTSWGFHDAWSAGLVGPYVLVVWVGNFDGRPNPEFIGAKTAAPLFFRIADALPLALPKVLPTPDKAPPELVRIEVCSASGELPNRWCPKTHKTWYWPGVSPIKVSTLHRPVLIDMRTGNAACPPYDPQYAREQVFEFWPSDIQRLFRSNGIARRLPPSQRSTCQAAGDASEAPQITSPLTYVTYTLRLSQPAETIPLTANAAGDARTLFWFVDHALLGQNPPQTAMTWRPEKSGRYRVRVTDDRGRSATRNVQVEFVP